MASFGAQLKREREQRKISLEDISASTKIGTRFLRAIEENQFDHLPGGIFNKGFIRAYAHYLGLDEEQAVADYVEATTPKQAEKKSEAPTPTSTVADHEDNVAAQFPWGTAAVVLLIAALSLAIWAFYSQQKQAESDQHSTNTEVIAGSASPRAAETKPAAAAVPAAVPPDQTSSARTFVVLLRAHDDSWISATVDGGAPTEASLINSNEKSFEAHRQVVLKAGNIGALDVYFNGEKIPSQGRDGEVKTLTFDSKGLQSPGKPQATVPTDASHN